ncbi:hypothetical protein V5O48_012508, partial [Marasmius crinis-equi]
MPLDGDEDIDSNRNETSRHPLKPTTFVLSTPPNNPSGLAVRTVGMWAVGRGGLSEIEWPYTLAGKTMI